MSRWPFRSWRKPSSCSRVSTTPAGRSCRPPTWPAHSERTASTSEPMHGSTRASSWAGATGIRGRSAWPQQLRRRPTGQRGDTAQARPLLEESLTRRSLGEPRGVVTTLSNLGVIALLEGEPDRAARLFAEQLALAQQAGLVLHLLGPDRARACLPGRRGRRAAVAAGTPAGPRPGKPLHGRRMPRRRGRRDGRSGPGRPPVGRGTAVT